ncbi:MAG: hypothetical protein A4S09_05930 [Proteobacteria bacterium SG_bin7]|nr:MAG: hypothetical protein A4S09_05930 [Proteobacteria bacterium SG_bin7]
MKFILPITILALLGCQSAKKDDAVVESSGSMGAVSSPVNMAVEEVSGPQAGDELEPIYFKYDSSKVEGNAFAILKQNAMDLKKNGATTVQIEGHCDPRGSDEYNFHLGEKRASAAKSALVKMGIEPSRIKIISYGKDKVEGHSEALYAKSRRASFVYLQ